MLLSFVVFITKLSAFNNDTIKRVKLPKHYFNHTYYFDYYAPGSRMLDTINTVSQKLNTYNLTQLNFGFNVPVVTKDFYSKDSTRISNIHFLLTGNYSLVQLKFSGIERHRLSKTSIGFRMVYNNGKKSIFFVELSPFSTQDRGYRYTRTTRLSGSIIYNYAVNEYFSFRLGLTRSFIWGNRFHLPYVGIRVGKLDKVNFSIQFPRSISFNAPINKYIRMSLYTKPQGGLYSFANTDSIELGNINENNKLFFGRYEFLAGARVDVLPSKKIDFYLSTGFTTQNKIAFYPTKGRRDNLVSYSEYYSEKIKPSMFINFGLVFRFGKIKSIYNNSGIYSGIDMNNSIDNADNGVNLGNGNIPVLPKKTGKIKTDDVLDLIETQDMY
jgi:hypothetical protein